jgi:hypothetical protein
VLINVTITLGPDEFAGDLSGNATEIAERILQAVGGDKDKEDSKDVCSVNIQDSGVAGAAPTMSGPPHPV